MFKTQFSASKTSPQQQTQPSNSINETRNDMPVILQNPSFLEVVNNHIYFYTEIQRETILQLSKVLMNMNSDFSIQGKAFNLKEDINIFIHINSYGGELFSGLSMVDEMNLSTLPVNTIVDGMCASAATLISVCGARRFIKKNSFMLIHQLSSGYWGTYSQCNDEIANQKQLMNTIKEIYLTKTKIPEAKLDQILKHDLLFDAKTCLKFGLVDEIL